MQKINLLGMNLTDYTLKESQGIVERYLNSGNCNTIVFLSAKMLVGAGVSEAQKNWMENIDLIAWSDAETLKKAGVTAKSRIHEVENQEFIRDFLKRLAKGSKTVYLLADSESELDRFREDLYHVRTDLRIIGGTVIERGTEKYDAIVNAINTVAPTVIMSRMAYDQLESMMTTCRKYLNAEIWLATNYQMALNENRGNFFMKLVEKWYRMLLHQQVTEYEQKKQ